MSIRYVSVALLRSYSIGDEINGRKIAKFEKQFCEYPDHRDYYLVAKDADGKVLVEFVNAPMVIEHE